MATSLFNRWQIYIEVDGVPDTQYKRIIWNVCLLSIRNSWKKLFWKNIYRICFMHNINQGTSCIRSPIDHHLTDIFIFEWHCLSAYQFTNPYPSTKLSLYTRCRFNCVSLKWKSNLETFGSLKKIFLLVVIHVAETESYELRHCLLGIDNQLIDWSMMQYFHFLKFGDIT